MERKTKLGSRKMASDKLESTARQVTLVCQMPHPPDRKSGRRERGVGCGAEWGVGRRHLLLSGKVV